MWIRGNLAPGTYYGLVRVASAGAGNSPQLVSVVLKVLAPGEVPAPEVLRVGSAADGNGGRREPTDTIKLTNLANVAQAFTSAVSTDDGGAWLSVSPASGTVPASGSAVLTVQVNTAGLTAGVRHGLVRLAFPDGTVRTVSVVSVLAPAATAAEWRETRPAGGGAGGRVRGELAGADA